jgi:hypothetical protein
MPSQRPCAAFEPISPDLDLAALVEATPNFEYVVRVHCDMIDHQGKEAFEKLVLLHVILGGKPLVIEGYQERLDRWTFALQWLRDNCSQKGENPYFVAYNMQCCLQNRSRKCSGPDEEGKLTSFDRALPE